MRDVLTEYGQFVDGALTRDAYSLRDQLPVFKNQGLSSMKHHLALSRFFPQHVQGKHCLLALAVRCVSNSETVSVPSLAHGLVDIAREHVV